MNDEVLNNLPKDTETLQKIVVDYHQENLRLREQIKLMQHRKFAKKSEKSDPAQLSLFDEPEQPKEEPEPQKESVEVKSYSRKKRATLPKNLPREQKHYDLSADEKICACGESLCRIGEETYEQLEYIPATVKVIEHIKAKYACRSCQEGVKTAQMPKQPIPKSIATPGLLSQVITSKYEDHLPLYRQEAMLKRVGIILPRATLSNWIFKSAELLYRLVDLLKANIVTSNYAHADESTLNVISEQENRSKCYMWVFMAEHNGKYSVVYEYHPSRSAEVPNNFFNEFSGYLQTDGYAGYNDLREKPEITPLGCWAHVRRKFYEITKVSKKSGSADVAMSFITKLYQVEKEAKDRNLDVEEIKSLREEKTKPILDKFKAWLDKTITRAPPKSAIGQALAYALNQWPTLTTYCLDGNLQPDNNRPERMIKPFACGRKNWMFQGNTRGAKASAVLYSLVQTCKANNVPVYDYLRYVLTELPNCSPDDGLEKFLPQNFEPVHS